MKKIITTAILAALGAGTVALSATSASAYTVCNRAGECWHSDSKMRYREPGIVVHPDDWYFHQTWDKDHRWRAEDHRRERGFWRNGVWVRF